MTFDSPVAARNDQGRPLSVATTLALSGGRCGTSTPRLRLPPAPQAAPANPRAEHRSRIPPESEKFERGGESEGWWFLPLRLQVPPLDSRPSSPALYFAHDASLVHKSPDPFGAVAAQKFSLAHSMLAISGHLDSDDDSGSGSLVGIDNKIEQAMDLVKSHLMFAVREEVEVLKEQIRELAERNAALEQENGLLRALASPEQLAQLPSSGVPRLGPSAPNGPSV
ncbi:PREDICTED: TSC22 domain family protein 4 [Rhinopithecus bieti]|uniref:TSC22 domain family member 4 n=1 Tax=Rhinopithecus bieti TaxID=61621 RepID=A0A2K6LG28_RHIBE|nr:PREDICTED: TSC22 domain family protein 4 [Rhinopithecus bieti]